MRVQDIAKLSKLLGQFLSRFADCFARPAGRALLLVDVRGLLSNVQRKNAEAMALDQQVPPRTLQRFLEGLVGCEQRLRDRCQQIVASEHADPEAIGCIDETGTAQSGSETAGVKRQYNGGHRRAALVAGRSKTASTASLWRIPRLASIACWMRSCTCRVNGRTIRRVEKNLPSRRRGVSDQTPDRAGSDRSRAASRSRHPAECSHLSQSSASSVETPAT
jgi:DDE superfamily endonuclease